jgi:DNA phosphorothioation-dependent restriction protein DptG
VSSGGVWLLHFLDHFIEVEGRRFLPWREFLERLEELADNRVAASIR